MIRALLLAAAALAVLAACATTTPQPGQSGKTGMDRVSPVRAAEVNTRLGIGYLERNELELAINKLQRALEFDPAHTPARVTLALIYEQLDRDRQAHEHLKQAIQQAPDDGGTLNTYAAFLCRQGDYQQADEYYQRALEDPFYRTPEVALANAGVCARNAGRPEEARSYLRRALDQNPEYPQALFELAQLYLEEGDALRARAFLQRYEVVAGDAPDALLLGYRIESRLGNAVQADRYFKRLEAGFPDSSQARELRQQPSNHD